MRGIHPDFIINKYYSSGAISREMTNKPLAPPHPPPTPSLDYEACLEMIFRQLHANKHSD